MDVTDPLNFLANRVFPSASRVHPSDCIMVVVDMQGKLLNIVQESDLITRKTIKMVLVAKELQIPIIVTEQIKIGETCAQLKEVFPPTSEPIKKHHFSCCGCHDFQETLFEISTLEKSHRNRKRVLLVGIEAHICVYQTAVDLAKGGYSVLVLADCVSSRVKYDKKIALKRLDQYGVEVTTFECLVMQLLGDASGDIFRFVLNLLKS